MARRLTPSHAAFLRGVNLAGHRKTGSAELRSCLEAIGLDEVQTFRTSGNVVFDAGREAQAKLTGRLEAALQDSFGFEIKVFLRPAKQLRAIAAHQPFPAKAVERSEGKLQVALLEKAPPAAARDEVLAMATDDGSAGFWGFRALLAARRAYDGLGAQPKGHREADRCMDHEDQGDDRAAGG